LKLKDTNFSSCYVLKRNANTTQRYTERASDGTEEVGIEENTKRTEVTLHFYDLTEKRGTS